MTSPATASTARLDGLRRLNIGVGLAHLVQAIAILALSNGFVMSSVWLRPESESACRSTVCGTGAGIVITVTS